MIERRSEIRLSDVELVMISWRDKQRIYKQLGNVEDICSNGIGVLVDHPLPVGTQLSLSYGEGQFGGIVRHCAPRADRYLLGIQFTEEDRNLAIHFHPEFLINL
jgi:hypothetical protein